MEILKFKVGDNIDKIVSDRVKSVPLDKVQKDLSNILIHQKEAIRSLYIGFACNLNVVLWGDGGYGKTVTVKKFCNYFGIPLSAISGYKDMEVEKLIGMPDVNKMMEESRVETKFGNSAFANPGGLVLEEFLDVRPETACCLKDIITEKGLREGNAFTQSRISTIVICTNKDPEDYLNDPEFAALYISRFPIICNVEWKNPTSIMYLELFKTTGYFESHEAGFRTIASLCANAKLSPRTALYAANILVNLGIEEISILKEFKKIGLEKLLEDHKVQLKIETETEKLVDITSYVSNLSAQFIEGSVEPNIFIKLLNSVEEKLSTLEIWDNNKAAIDTLEDLINESICLAEKEILPDIKLSTEQSKEIDELFKEE